LTVLVGIVLAWNLALLTNPQKKAPFKLFMIASISLIVAIWLLIYAVPDVRFRADLFGMMVSFFILAIPTILAWEALMDGCQIKTDDASLNRIGRIAVVVLISIASGSFAIYQGSVMWIT
jgi:signal transduction histidine kinase